MPSYPQFQHMCGVCAYGYKYGFIFNKLIVYAQEANIISNAGKKTGPWW